MLAARSDVAAAALVGRWRDAQARLLTTTDLAAPGWQIRSDALGQSRAVVDGEVVPAARIRGVLVRLPAVVGSELPMLAAEDRTYAAAEMTAFLSFWLSTLPAPVLNRPGAAGLCAPGWRPEQWVRAAAGLGGCTGEAARRP